MLSTNNRPLDPKIEKLINAGNEALKFLEDEVEDFIPAMYAGRLSEVKSKIRMAIVNAGGAAHGVR